MPVPSILFFASCFVLIIAKPQDAKVPETPSPALLPVPQDTHTDSLHETPIPIISHAESFGESGNFNFSYDTGNGIHFEQSGYTKQVPNVADHLGTDQDGDGFVQVMSGSFSYPAPDGTQISLSYVADENGYQPIGDHLPTPPPIPESIQRILSILPKLNDQYNSDAGAVTETSS